MWKKNLLKTYEISTEIIKMISSTKSYCYIVSPYIKLWPQLERALNEASQKGTFITFIIREDPKMDFLINKLNHEYGFEVIVIKDIHIKLFLNEQKCLISSMNLYDASQQNNLEIAYELGRSKDLKKEIIDQYILTDKTAVTYKGRFEEKRKEQQAALESINKTLNQSGYCVDCKKEIDPDFNPYNPKYIRCKSCYYSLEDPYIDTIKFCHFCGKDHNSTEDKPFHYDCVRLLKEYHKEVKNH